MRLRLGTRGSTLAVTQSEFVAEALRSLGHDVELVRITTRGDRMRGSLTTAAGMGVFAAELRRALLDGECDFAVHSLKDLPVEGVPGLVLAAIPEREDPRDALCSLGGRRLAELPSGARMGTGSPRRVAQLRGIRPDLDYVDIRGNIDTRLSRVADGDLDAVVLAAAGLRRLGLHGRITEFLDILPSPGQGALALECREDNVVVREALAALDHAATRIAVTAERALLKGLGGGCAAPIAALGTLPALTTPFDTPPLLPHGGTQGTKQPPPATQKATPRSLSSPATERRPELVEGSPGVSKGHPHPTTPFDTPPLVPHGGTQGTEPAPPAAQEATPRSLGSPTTHEPIDRSLSSPATQSPGVSKGPLLTGAVFALDGSATLMRSVRIDTPEAAGRQLAEHLVTLGAGEICDIAASRDSRLQEFHDDVHNDTALWPRRRSLHDASVFLPREAGALSAAIEAAGPRVFCEPVIERHTLSPTGTLEGVDWVAITSARSVETLSELGWRIPETARIAAVGRATARALESVGYTVDLVPDGPSSAADLLRVWPEGTGRVVVPGSALSSPELVDGLRARGWTAEALPIYTVTPVSAPSTDLQQRWDAGQFDAVVVTSGSVARAIDELLGWSPKLRVLAFGQPSAAALARLGVAAAVAQAQDPDSIAQALTDLLSKGQA